MNLWLFAAGSKPDGWMFILNHAPKANPEKWPQRHKDTKQNCLLRFIFVFGCLGGENVLPQIVDIQ
jgi:hypothetical protein